MLGNLFGIRKNVDRKTSITISTLAFVILFGVWSLASVLHLADESMLPTPWAVFGFIIKSFADGSIYADMWVSIYRIVMGFIISVIIGVPLGIAIGTFKIAECIFRPICEFVRYMPVPAFLPLVMMWVGIGEEAKIGVILLGTLFQMILMVMDDALLVSNDLLNSGYTLGANKFQVLCKILIPAMMPKLMDTLRILMGWAWTYVTVAELVAANSGLGYSIMKAQRFLQTDAVYAGILIIGFLGLIFDRLFALCNKKLFHWVEGA
ncbi:MAG: ABC transporter permease [Lachnospiraceae bacterium]|nr:ABC transporter permease [Lachnospiraceae bacterium]